MDKSLNSQAEGKWFETNRREAESKIKVSRSRERTGIEEGRKSKKKKVSRGKSVKKLNPGRRVKKMRRRKSFIQTFD